VCAGPGSFTGVRVGLSTAWGLSRAAGIPLEAVSTLEALAETARGEGPRRVIAALDAGRGDAVCRAYELGGARAEPLGEAERVPLDRARELARGTAVVSLPASLLEGPGAKAGAEEASPPRPRPAAALARAVAAAPGRDASSLEAIYSRPSAAEEKRGVAP
jgi:tRNA threonylcarbamoyladenosine biosynthesis protein TsaB